MQTFLSNQLVFQNWLQNASLVHYSDVYIPCYHQNLFLDIRFLKWDFQYQESIIWQWILWWFCFHSIELTVQKAIPHRSINTFKPISLVIWLDAKLKPINEKIRSNFRSIRYQFKKHKLWSLLLALKLLFWFLHILRFWEHRTYYIQVRH